MAVGSNVLRKKWSDLVGTKLLKLSNKLTDTSGGTETFWTVLTYMWWCLLILVGL